MTEFIRPKLRRILWHWREVIVTFAITALFGWWALASFGVMFWIWLTAMAIAAGFSLAAIQRARFAQDGAGVGVVEVDEGVVSYLTAHMGAQVEIAALSAVMLVPQGKKKATWLLDAPGQMPVQIPLDAHGADQLFDVFVGLDGIETEKMLRQIKQMPDKPVVVWKKRTELLH